MAVKAKRIKCARCGERETVTRGERGPVSIYCDLCRLSRTPDDAGRVAAWDHEYSQPTGRFTRRQVALEARSDRP